MRYALLALALSASEVFGACTSAVLPVAFGAYNPFTDQNSDSTGAVNVICVPPAAYTISLSSGQGSFDARSMINGPFRLHYNLYTNVSRSVVWGDGTGGSSTVGGSGATANYAIYGRIPANQNVGAGAYNDGVVVTVSF
jgi:spore coat protein U-like protein